jgi:Carbohydrate esterase, sialic acid-specific acetylesterase
MNLFLLIGQSNMAGRGVVGAADRVTNPRIFMLTRELSWKLATDPVHFDKPIAGVGLSSEFARVLVKSDPKIVVGLIPCAVGGTSLDQWSPGGTLYVNAVARAREAMKRGTLTGILWHQGEADIAHDRVVTYGVRFASMIAHLRTDLGAGSVPVVIGEIGRFRRENAEFNAIVPSVARGIPLCSYVTTENLKDRGDGLHFDTPSLYLLGQRYAAAYMALAVQSQTGAPVASP